MPDTKSRVVGKVIDVFIDTDGHKQQEYFTVGLNEESEKLFHASHLKVNLSNNYPNRIYDSKELLKARKTLIGKDVVIYEDKDKNKTLKVDNKSKSTDELNAKTSS